MAACFLCLMLNNCRSKVKELGKSKVLVVLNVV